MTGRIGFERYAPKRSAKMISMMINGMLADRLLDEAQALRINRGPYIGLIIRWAYLTGGVEVDRRITQELTIHLHTAPRNGTPNDVASVHVELPQDVKTMMTRLYERCATPRMQHAWVYIPYSAVLGGAWASWRVKERWAVCG
jgi:hypothetical protein